MLVRPAFSSQNFQLYLHCTHMQRRSWMVPTVGSWLPGCHKLKLKQGRLFLLWFQDSWEFYSSPPNNVLPSANSERGTPRHHQITYYPVQIQKEGLGGETEMGIIREKRKTGKSLRSEEKRWGVNKKQSWEKTAGGFRQRLPRKEELRKDEQPVSISWRSDSWESLTGCIFWNKRKLSPQSTAVKVFP